MTLTDRLQTCLRSFDAFLSTPRDPAPLGMFRIAISGFALLQAALWWGDWMAFFGSDGWIQWEISRAQILGWNIHLSHIHELLAPFGVTEGQTVLGFYWSYVTATVGLLLGWHTRVWAIICWVLHSVIMSTIPSFIYGVDIFLQIALFYLVVMPVGYSLSLDCWQGRATDAPTWAATLSLRVLQFHLCMVYASAGLEKARSADWWNGSTLWRSLVQPDFKQANLEWLAYHPWLVVAGSIFTIVIESGYPIAMWVPRLRTFWLLGIVALHAGIMLLLGLRLFGLIMILLSLSAFGADALADVRKMAAYRRPLKHSGLVVRN